MDSNCIKFNGKYLIVVNGKIMKVFSRKETAYRWCLRYSVDKNNYVELWYQPMDGDMRFYCFWN